MICTFLYIGCSNENSASVNNCGTLAIQMSSLAKSIYTSISIDVEEYIIECIGPNEKVLKQTVTKSDIANNTVR